MQTHYSQNSNDVETDPFCANERSQVRAKRGENRLILQLAQDDGRDYFSPVQNLTSMRAAYMQGEQNNQIVNKPTEIIPTQTELTNSNKMISPKRTRSSLGCLAWLLIIGAALLGNNSTSTLASPASTSSTPQKPQIMGLSPSSQQRPNSSQTLVASDTPSYIATGKRISKILNEFFDVS